MLTRRVLLVAIGVLIAWAIAPSAAMALPPVPGNFTATNVPGSYPYVQQHVALSWTGPGYQDPTYPYTHYRLYRRVFRPSGVGTWEKIYENPCLASYGEWTADDYDQPPNGAVWQYKVAAQQTLQWCAQPSPENPEVEVDPADYVTGGSRARPCRTARRSCSR